MLPLTLLVNIGANQQATKKSVVPPSFTDAGGLRPLTVNLPQQQQQDPATQGFPQPQAQALDANPALNPAQMTFGDQVRPAPQASSAAQPFAPVPSEPQAPAQAPAQVPLQNPQKALDQVQGGVLQSPEQAFAPQAAAPSDMQAPGAENMAAAFPMSKKYRNAWLLVGFQVEAGQQYWANNTIRVTSVWILRRLNINFASKGKKSDSRLSFLKEN